MRTQEGKNAQQDKQHLQSHTGVPSGNLERFEPPDRWGMPGQSRLGGWQGPSLHARLRYLSCPEGNREPPKGLAQGVHRGRVAMHDLSVGLLLGHGQTASNSSQCGAAAPPNSSPPPHATSLQATGVFPLSPKALRLLTRSNHNHRFLGSVPAATGNQPSELRPGCTALIEAVQSPKTSVRYATS